MQPQLLTSADAQAPIGVWRRHYATPSGHREWPCEELVRAVATRKFHTVLEAGCGNGSNLWMLAERARRVIGIDSSPEALAAATKLVRRRNVSTKISLRLGDVLSLPVPDGSCDGIVDTMTSQHLPWSRHVDAYVEYRRALAPGGWFFLYHLGRGTSKDGAKPIETFTYDHLPTLFPGVGPVCLPQAPALAAAVEEAGFRLQATRTLTRTYPDGAVATYIVMEALAV